MSCSFGFSNLSILDQQIRKGKPNVRFTIILVYNRQFNLKYTEI